MGYGIFFVIIIIYYIYFLRKNCLLVFFLFGGKIGKDIPRSFSCVLLISLEKWEKFLLLVESCLIKLMKYIVKFLFIKCQNDYSLDKY